MKLIRIIAITFLFIVSNSNALQPVPTDIPFEYTFNVPDNTYHKYCKAIYSQNGEDGILEQLLKELEITNGTFCEFGASNGITSSNTYNLIKNYNFSGIAIELDGGLYQQCAANYRQFPHVQVFQVAFFITIKTAILMPGLKEETCRMTLMYYPSI